MKEISLYEPVKELFIGLGYQVKAELKDIDMTAIKEDETLLIELKTDLNLKLILQGAKRQRLSDHVYVAVPKPNYKVARSASYRDKQYLLRRLGLGLIHVDIKTQVAKIVLDPVLMDIKAAQRRNKNKKEVLINEFEGLSLDVNIGGMQGAKMTLYKQNELKLLNLLKDGQPHSTKEMVIATGDTKIARVPQMNFNQYFERVKVGWYRLTDIGVAACDKHEAILQLLSEGTDRP